MSIPSPLRPEQNPEKFEGLLMVDGQIHFKGRVDLFKKLGQGTFWPSNALTVESSIEEAVLKLEETNEELMLVDLVPSKFATNWSFKIQS